MSRMKKTRPSEPLGIGHSEGSSDSKAIICLPLKQGSGWGGSLEVADCEFHPETGFWVLLSASQEEQGRKRTYLLLLFYLCIQEPGM